MSLPELRRPGPATADEVDRAKLFIISRTWTFAKTMPENPHHYTVRNRHPAPDDEFEYFVAMIRELGYQKEWGEGKRRTRYTYYELDGWKYWTMGAPIHTTTIINREKVA